MSLKLGVTLQGNPLSDLIDSTESSCVIEVNMKCCFNHAFPFYMQMFLYNKLVMDFLHRGGAVLSYFKEINCLRTTELDHMA